MYNFGIDMYTLSLTQWKICGTKYFLKKTRKKTTGGRIASRKNLFLFLHMSSHYPELLKNNESLKKKIFFCLSSWQL